MKISNPFKKKSPSCGLDLGSGWAKVVRLSSGGKGVSLESLGRMVWVQSDWERPEKTAEKLESLWQALGMKEKVVISSMAGHAVIIKRVNFSFSSEKELATIVQRDSKQYIPFDINDVYLDYQVLGNGKKDSQSEVLLVASKKNVVHELEEVLNRAGLGLSIVDVDAFALSNCFEYNYPELLEDATYLIDIGSQQSVFCVYWKYQPVFFREVSFGGQRVTDAIAKVLNTNRTEAEKVKLNGPKNLGEKQQDAIAQELQNLFSSWATELQRLIGFYQSSVPDAQSGKRLFLSGGGSLLSGMASSFSSNLNMEVNYLDPWKNIQKDSNKFDPKFLQQTGPQFAVPVGLALRSVYP